MTTVPPQPPPPGTINLVRGALVTVGNGTQRNTIAFQYNPTTLRRSLQSNTVGGAEGDRAEAVRFVGAAVETVTLDAQFDATDGLDAGDPTTVSMGIYPTLSALALLVYPSTTDVRSAQQKLQQGQIEVMPALAPNVLFVWGKRRVLPVRVAQMNITEQFFDSNLNPIQATVSLTLRVMTYSDLLPSNPGYQEFLTYQQGLEAMAPEGFTNNASQVTGVDLNKI
ncbi:MAG: hypothetical protein AAF799_20685 [Myxococcota bacterium]